MVTKDADIVRDPPYFAASQTLDDGDDMDLDPGERGLDTLIVRQIVHEGDGDVTLLQDADGDGTAEREVTVDSVSGTGVSMGNELEVSGKDMVFRFTDTSGGTSNDVIVTGREVR